MTILSASNALTYCLAIAQLIPVFLIALYIIDYSWVTNNVKDGTRATGLQEGYAKRAVRAIIIGIIGEIIVLGGAIGLFSRLVAVAAGTGIVIFVAGTLSEPAVDRLSWKDDSALYRFLRNRLLPIVVLAALIAFLYILIRVRIVP